MVKTDPMIKRDTKKYKSIKITKKFRKYKRQKFDEYFKRKIAYSQKYICACGCGELLKPTSELDHIQPISCNGSNDRKNLQYLNPGCHAKKSLEEREKVRNYIKKEMKSPDYMTTCWNCLNYFCIDKKCLCISE